MFLQTRLFSLLLPALLAAVSRLLLLAARTLAASASPAALSLEHLFLLLLLRPLALVAELFRLLGLILSAVLYGWYGFDMVSKTIGNKIAYCNLRRQTKQNK